MAPLGVTPITKLPALAATIAIGFTMSFGIELAQAWIPFRTSSLLDLLLNVAGVGVGAAAFAVLSQSNRLSLTPWTTALFVGCIAFSDGRTTASATRGQTATALA